MLPPLDNSARVHALRIAAALCAVPVLLVPIAARSSRSFVSGDSLPSGTFTHAALPIAGPVPAVRIERDPFAGDPPEPSVPASSVTNSTIVGMRVVQGQSTGIAVPQAAAVRAIATGANGTRALVEEGGETRIVSAGDIIDGSRIVEITAGAVVLSNGVRLQLAQVRP